MDRFEDPNNDPARSLDSKLADLADPLMRERNPTPDAAFAWAAEPAMAARVHRGTRHRAA